jgi:carbamoyl-phosphate synthase small subunit
MTPSSELTAKLALEDGTVFTGLSFGAEGETHGEVVFNTSMTGYQEILTDPSYRGQIVAMTYPQIGNYGVNAEDIESGHPHVAGFVVREATRLHSNYRSTGTLDQYLRHYGIVGIREIDTRRLVRLIRDRGALRGVISTVTLDDEALVAAARHSPGLVGRDLVREVLPEQPARWAERLSDWWDLSRPAELVADAARPHVIALDFGMKRNIARHLFQQGFDVTILPGTATVDKILSHEPHGVFLSNGPGDPEPLDWAIATVRQLLPVLPLFGICLGHQLFALACGAQTYKLKFGHRGANQPVLDLATGRVEITTQNHGFAVEEATLPADLVITHRHLNDQTIAGLRHRTLPAMSVQYHPEASAGPHDSQYLFAQFRQLIERRPVPIG